MNTNGNAPNPIRVLVVDDHTVIRRGLVGFLEAMPDFDCVGETDDGNQAIYLCERLQPDVVLMDVMLPGRGGIAAAAVIRSQFPQVQVIMLTSFNNDHLVQQARHAGAIGYLLKDTSIHDIAVALRAAHQGQATFTNGASRKPVVSGTAPLNPEHEMHARRIKTGRLSAVQSGHIELRPIERQILARLADGLDAYHAGLELKLPLATVRFHIANILAKLDVDTVPQAVAYAIQKNLINARIDSI